MEMLRVATAGSVDDGKSTLIGRLLYDTKSIFADQLEAVERTSAAWRNSIQARKPGPMVGRCRSGSAADHGCRRSVRRQSASRVVMSARQSSLCRAGGGDSAKIASTARSSTSSFVESQ